MPLDRIRATQLKALGANIRRERVSQGISQERLGEMASLHPRTIQKIEAGRVDILYTAFFLGKAYGQALTSTWFLLFVTFK
jgi:transcriptional regulator with XRE-family HTH domain